MSRRHRSEDDYRSSRSRHSDKYRISGRSPPPRHSDRHREHRRHYPEESHRRSPPDRWSNHFSPPTSRRRVALSSSEDYYHRHEDYERHKRGGPDSPGHWRGGHSRFYREDRRSEEHFRRPKEPAPSSGRPVRVPPPAPPLSEFTKKSSDPNCFERVSSSDDDDDIEEGEVTEKVEKGPYTANFCAPVKCAMDDETIIHFSEKMSRDSPMNGGGPSRDHPVVKQLLSLEPSNKKPKLTTSAVQSSFVPPASAAATGASNAALEVPNTATGVSNNVVEEELEEGEANQEDITFEFIQERCEFQLLDKEFMSHLAEINPISALHEITRRLGWSLPNMKVAFECGPPMMEVYIYKAIVNGQEYQPAVAVDNKKDAKANAAWFALQEMGFIKPDISNPL